MERRYQNTAFWMNLGVVSLLLAALIIVAPMVSAVYGRPELRLVLVVLAAAFWMQVVGVVHRNLLRKQLRFGALAISEVLASAASFLVAVVLAWRGQGVWAFVCALVAANSVSFLSLWAFSRWTPRWEWSRAALKDIGVFSGWYLAATIVFYFAFSLDRLLIGKFLSVEKLGWYVLAYDLSLAMIGALLMPVQQATVPELARLRETPAQFWEGYIRISRLTAAVASPLAFAAALAAPVVLPLVFGPKWMPSILSFQVLVILMLIRSVLADPFAAWGRFDLAFRVGLGMVVFGLCGILWGMRFGIVGVALAVAVFMLAGQVVAIAVMGSTRELMHLCRRAAPFVAVAGGTCGIGWIVERSLRGFFGFPSIAAIVIAVAIHLGFYAWIFRREINGVWLVFARRGAEIL